MLKKSILKNIFFLYGLNIAKIIFPLVTLPYLTRVLTVECYGVVAFVKYIMQYMQITIDFGFSLSGTKEIAMNRDNKHEVEHLIGDILVARILLGVALLIVLLFLLQYLTILKEFTLYTFLSYVSVFASVFLFDFYFQGIEKMQVITTRFVIMKTISTLLTFILVHSDDNVLWIPILDNLGMLVAIGFNFFELHKEKISIRFSSLTSSLEKLRISFIYFISNMATTTFGALNALIIGAYLTPIEVAFWSVCMQLIGGIQTMFTPIISGVYPEMVRYKDFNLVLRLLKVMLPLIIFGCMVAVWLAKYALLIIAGPQYMKASWLLCSLLPVVVFSFPAMLLGWPTLGAINKVNQVSATTIFTALFTVIGLLFFVAIGRLSLFIMALIRCISEFVLLISRVYYCWHYKSKFAKVY